MKNFIEFGSDTPSIFPYKKIKKDILLSDMPTSKMLFIENEDYNNRYWYMDKKELNNFGYRCDNFIKSHNSFHILFTGCSHTFGDGLLLNETWSKRLYDKIKLEANASGYFNLGIPGSSFAIQVIDLFKYFNNFGNPDFIFINITDLNRMLVYNKENKTFYDGTYSSKSKDILDILNYQYYYMLSQYCNSNNIKLFSFSWKEKNNFIYNFNTFYSYGKKELAEYVVEYKNNNKYDKYSEIARDNMHPGNAYHSFWSKFMYNVYKEKNDNTWN